MTTTLRLTSALASLALLLHAVEAHADRVRSDSCIETVCLGDGVDELRKTKWRDRKPLPRPPDDPLSELKALGPFPGLRALDLVPRIEGVCEYDIFGQMFNLENESRYLVAKATWVPSASRQTQRFEVREIEVIYATTKAHHAKALRERCSDIISRVRPRIANALENCSDESVSYFRYTNESGDTLVDVSGDLTNYEKVSVRLLRIDNWSEERFDLAGLSGELRKLPACQRK